jgi:hypothetical protein
MCIRSTDQPSETEMASVSTGAFRVRLQGATQYGARSLVTLSFRLGVTEPEVASMYLVGAKVLIFGSSLRRRTLKNAANPEPA